MVNTRSKTKKTQNASETCFSQEDSEQQSTESKSGALIGSNDDLLTEILLRVPATSIFRFKSVSKHWRSLLSHMHFTLRYDKLLKSPGVFVHTEYVPFDVENRNTPPPFRCLNFVYDHNDIKIVQSCNGLLLCCSDGEAKRHRRYYVFNPTTKKFAFVPSVGGYRVTKLICFMGLAFSPTDCVHYKVVCIRKLRKKDPHDEELFQIQIYSSDTRNWKISVDSFSADSRTFKRGVYSNGAFHWAPFHHNHMYFDIEVEQLRSLPLPVDMVSSEMYFGESRGHLHLIVPSDGCGYNRLELSVYELLRDRSGWLELSVYELLRDRSGWFVKYQVDLDELPGAFPEMRSPPFIDFHVIDVVRGEEEEDTFMVLMIPGKLITYNVHDESFKLISSLTSYYFYEPSSTFHRYTEALASF